MRKNDDMVSLAELKARLRRFCERHRIQRLDVFGSAARGEAGPGSDVDLLVTLDESSPVSVAELLEMAGEAEEVVGRPVFEVLTRQPAEELRADFDRVFQTGEIQQAELAASGVDIGIVGTKRDQDRFFDLAEA